MKIVPVSNQAFYAFFVANKSIPNPWFNLVPSLAITSVKKSVVRVSRPINRLLDGFEGKLTSSKWAKLVKCSQDTALRDIGDQVEREILFREKAGGRSTSYILKV